MENYTSVTKKISYFVLFLMIIVGLSVMGQLIENNESGYVQVKQDAIDGDLAVRLRPGVYPQMFGTITTYKISDSYDFNDPSERIAVRFSDGSSATISGLINFRLPMTEVAILNIHRNFRSYDNFIASAVRQTVATSLKQSATHFRAEEVYSTRRADFIDLVNDQIKSGIYSTIYTEEWKKDDLDDKVRLIRRVDVKRDKDGSPIINEKSLFNIYDVELVGQPNINDIDFDDLTDGLIAKRKEAEQNQVVAKANAEKAKQDAITAQEQGKANIAIAEAQALVEAKKAVVEAEKNTKIAQQRALQADEDKKAIIAKGQADAEAARLKVAAGLSPLERANIEKDTAIGVAEQIAKVRFPGLMVIGGNGQGGAPVDPFTAVGLESLIKISKELTSSGNPK